MRKFKLIVFLNLFFVVSSLSSEKTESVDDLLEYKVSGSYSDVEILDRTMIRFFGVSREEANVRTVERNKKERFITPRESDTDSDDFGFDSLYCYYCFGFCCGIMVP